MNYGSPILQETCDHRPGIVDVCPWSVDFRGDLSNRPACCAWNSANRGPVPTQSHSGINTVNNEAKSLMETSVPEEDELS